MTTPPATPEMKRQLKYQRKDSGEDDVLDKALMLFWSKGYANTTMQQLAEATGVQRGSLYNAYGDKETLLLRAFRLYREKYVGQMRQALGEARLRESLRKFFGFVITSMTSGTPTRGCLSTKTAVGSEDLDGAIQIVLKDLLDDIEAAILNGSHALTWRDNLRCRHARPLG
ncbi:TetR/AcrR family transcriptional regulator [Cupriavidus sp. D39]|uniref:TetR/AcrR family transcriptional regulator n=1 Tax=Cupriavidus sp. D39 TaxID=2997877 RepID=UPI002D1E45B6|nr:TetR/AcrR family transcriptional regulator [Cupriavidus sp. D39]